jgi:hypothetical protein
MQLTEQVAEQSTSSFKLSPFLNLTFMRPSGVSGGWIMTYGNAGGGLCLRTGVIPEEI